MSTQSDTFNDPIPNGNDKVPLYPQDNLINDSLTQSEPGGPCREELVRRRVENTEKRVNEAVARQKENAQVESDRLRAKHEVSEILKNELDHWCLNDDGTIKDIRILLSSMQNVLWPDSEWESAPLPKLMISSDIVKRYFRKAIILCHPDKHFHAESSRQYRAERIFSALNDSYKAFE
eukprot:GHVO01039410.1.p1 GENE.GHVO01039410.1~~GHVO01039410.1.p1  ORF type:complete len:178 (-),score=35.18 GHVO01039410.1:139-672(-)